MAGGDLRARRQAHETDAWSLRAWPLVRDTGPISRAFAGFWGQVCAANAVGSSQRVCIPVLVPAKEHVEAGVVLQKGWRP